MVRRKSRKKTITMGFMLVLVAALVGVYVWQQRTGDSGYDDEIEETANLVLIQRPENEVVRVNFVRDGQRYYMTPEGDEPGFMTWLWGPAPDYVLHLVRAREKARLAWHLVATDVAHEDSTGMDLAAFGLNPPLFSMEAVYYDNTTQVINIGVQTADTRHHFIMIDGDPAIYLLPTLFAERAQTDIAELLDGRLPFFTWDAEYVLITQRDMPVIELSVTYDPDILDEASATFMDASPGALFLRMLQPLEGRGLNHAHLETYVMEPLNELRLAHVVSVAPTDLTPYGLDNPSLVFEYHSPAGEVKLLFGDVFMAVFEPAEVLFDLNVFLFIDRFIALIDIRDVASVITESTDAGRNYEMILNHQENRALLPTINGISVDEFDFRLVYRLLIALAADADVDPFTPQDEPEITVTFNRIENPDTEVRFFALDANFYGVSLNGADVWFVTHRRAIDVFFQYVEDLVSEE